MLTLPREPLEQMLRERWGPERRYSDADGKHSSDGYTHTRAAAALGITVEVWRKWKASGLTVVEADRSAIALGQMPEFIWGYDWDREDDVG